MTIKMIVENRMNITDSAELAYEEERISKNKTASYFLLIYFITHIKKNGLKWIGCSDFSTAANTYDFF